MIVSASLSPTLTLTLSPLSHTHSLSLFLFLSLSPSLSLSLSLSISPCVCPLLASLFDFELEIQLNSTWTLNLNLHRKDTSCSAFSLWNIFRSLFKFFFANLWQEICYVHVWSSCFLTTLIFISFVHLQGDCKSCFIVPGWSGSTPIQKISEALERSTLLRKGL